ncbi:hypothetical protein Mucpa_2481 [Mucilaginibacter paludis DSM 18603]|uniref:Uncharacterized protein n=1 Tax=Mucilaginibacter paludis DSM 18603 TaxID=714943 RepID=H1YIN3_9SPHI|nr:hypothetical protein Mucpa_2481 [Mucilaginibacter paludis DSM 18603]
MNVDLYSSLVIAYRKQPLIGVMVTEATANKVGISIA